jgi:DNA-binding CsgD family transcriptional regulator
MSSQINTISPPAAEARSLSPTSMLAAFDWLQFGVVLLDHNMHVLHSNMAAQRVFQRNDGLLLEQGMIRVRQLEKGASSKRLGSDTSFSNWLATIKDAADTRQVHFQEGCRVIRGSPRYYMVQCSAIAEGTEWAVQGARVSYAAFIHDPAAMQLPDVQSLRDIFGLTTVQAKVALAFADGCSYKEVARRLRMSEETVRSHVKELYPKTRVNKQADLVRLILSLAQNSV